MIIFPARARPGVERAKRTARKRAAWRYRAADAFDAGRARSDGCGTTRVGPTRAVAGGASTSVTAREGCLVVAVGFINAFKRSDASPVRAARYRRRGRPGTEFFAKCAAQCAASNRTHAGCGDCALPLPSLLLRGATPGRSGDL